MYDDGLVNLLEAKADRLLGRVRTGVATDQERAELERTLQGIVVASRGGGDWPLDTAD